MECHMVFFSWHPNVKILFCSPSPDCSLRIEKVLLGRVYNGSPRCVLKSVVSWMVYSKACFRWSFTDGATRNAMSREGWSSGFPSCCQLAVVRCVLLLHSHHPNWHKFAFQKMNNDRCFWWRCLNMDHKKIKRSKWSCSLGAHPHVIPYPISLPTFIPYPQAKSVGLGSEVVLRPVSRRTPRERWREAFHKALTTTGLNVIVTTLGIGLEYLFWK